MTGGLVLSWGLLAVLTAQYPPEPPRGMPRLDDIADHFRYPGVEVAVTWQECGHLNAYYHPPKKLVVMCTELLGLSDHAIRFFFAHELAHAVIHQAAIPYTGSGEVAADELASLVLVLSGNRAAVDAGADYFGGLYVQGWEVHPLAEHPDHLRRALTLKCHALGRASVHFNCPRDWNRLVWTWDRLLPRWED